jgi:hypothetical protein
MKSRPRVKICCIKSPEEAAQAVANFTFEDFLSLKRFLRVSEREAPRD